MVFSEELLYILFMKFLSNSLETLCLFYLYIRKCFGKHSFTVTKKLKYISSVRR